MRVLYFFVRAFDTYFPFRIRQKKKSLVLVARIFLWKKYALFAVMHVHLSIQNECL
jgi:hypothetical protein